MKRTALGLSAALVFSSWPVDPQTAVAAAQVPAVAPIAIEHEAVGCVLAGEFVVIEARLSPAENVARARVQFRAEAGAHWYSVDMKRDGGLYKGVLPIPKATLKSVDYAIEVTGTDIAPARSAEHRAAVVATREACRTRLAAGVTTADVAVVAAPGAPAVPPGFETTGLTLAGAQPLPKSGAAAPKARGAGKVLGIVAGLAFAGGLAAAGGGGAAPVPSTRTATPVNERSVSGSSVGSRTVPDNDPVGVASQIVVPEAGPISEVRVALRITHPSSGDLRLVLRHPDGTEVVLQTATREPHGDGLLSYDTQNQPGLRSLLAKRSGGVWVLTGSDLVAGHIGSVDAWSLQLRVRE